MLPDMEVGLRQSQIALDIADVDKLTNYWC